MANVKGSAKDKKIGAIAESPEKMVPKFCNNVSFAKTTNNEYILTMMFRDSANEAPIVLDRYIVNEKHAKEMVKVLSDLIKKK